MARFALIEGKWATCKLDELVWLFYRVHLPNLQFLLA
jgi:hypothetical protein